MIQAEFKDLVFKFAKEASLKEVAYILLFGSVAKGDADRRSDIDLLVVFDTDSEDYDEFESKTSISQIALDLEKEFDRNIQILFSNRNFHGLDQYFVRRVMIEGILLYASPVKVEVDNLGLEPFALILYNLKDFDVKEQRKIRRLLLGHKTKKKVNIKTYESVKEGLIQDLDGKYIGGGLFTIPQKNVQAMEEWLEKSKVEFKRLDMWLAEDDIIKIRA